MPGTVDDRRRLPSGEEGGVGARPKKVGGIPWGEWDAATRSTRFGGFAGSCNARIDVRPELSLRNIWQPSKRFPRFGGDISLTKR